MAPFTTPLNTKEILSTSAQVAAASEAAVAAATAATSATTISNYPATWIGRSRSAQ